MICFAWSGMPAYAAGVLREYIKSTQEQVCLVGTGSDVPKTVSDVISGVTVNWVNYNDLISLEDLLGEIPRVLVVSGWAIPAFNNFIEEMHKYKRPVIALSDNQFEVNFKLLLWIPYFFFKVRPRFDGFMVPGRSGRLLLRCGGVSGSRIATSMYSGDVTVFRDGGALECRKKKIVYVGRFLDLKNIVSFAVAFKKFAKKYPEWQLDCYGQGPKKEELENIAAQSNNSIVIHSFRQPEELSKVYSDARVLVLPSHWDHWGVVVHEATLSGCALLLSNKVGSGWDLCSKENGRVFNHRSISNMVSMLEEMNAWTDREWQCAHKKSLDLAKKFSPSNFVCSLNMLLDSISNKQ